jgi:8-oxo-dGTP pyrophosphatase MutT (NUDIX family)
MPNPFKLISTRKIYGNPWISVREDVVMRPGGKEGIFGIVTMKDGVTIIAVDHENNIITTNEFAYAMDNHSFEVVSGGIDSDESPLECAKRELKEET